MSEVNMKKIMNQPHPWSRFKKYATSVPTLGITLDISHMPFEPSFLEKMEPKIQAAFQSMTALEAGEIANPDENRRVGHYWLRAPELAPDEVTRKEILDCLKQIHFFAKKVHSKKIVGESGPFENLLIIGIGGSALGPEFVSEALGHPATDCLRAYFFDNTDSDGMDRVLAKLKGQLGKTLTVVISKSGGTPEPRNGMKVAEAAYEAAKLSFARHTVAITGVSSPLDKLAADAGWLARFPMWDWVGGRTSELAAVGLLPAVLQGIDIDGMLHGAKLMDEATRQSNTLSNPAALLALMWYWSTEGVGKKDMVVLPYKDRLALFSKYLQQLVMESLGKEKDLLGNIVHQGIAVYGNKGSTDQHAYVQQLRDGVANFFVTFIEVLKHADAPEVLVEGRMTSGDFLQGFLLGTRAALYEKGRYSITVVLPDVSPVSVGALIALYERAVGFYGSLVNVNAYHQPGVEAGKKAAAIVLSLKEQILEILEKNPFRTYTAEQIAEKVGTPDVHIAFYLLEDLVANRGVKKNEGTDHAIWSAEYAALRQKS
jgi:glucose-6-phosphate isomerase